MADNGRRHTRHRARDTRFVGRDVIRLVPSPVAARQGPTIRAAADQAWTAAGTPRHNLPAAMTRFVGRERELANVERLLSTTCLLTLTGSGGIGKTRLALEAASDLMDNYPDGVWLVELAPLADPSLVTGTVATVLGVREQPGRPLPEALADALRPKQLLLVLDNCEHLIGACATLANTLLQACPELRILATSRQPLGIAGETDWRVPSLDVPSLTAPPLASTDDVPTYEAVRLFIDRAQAARPDFALGARSSAAIAQICARLDGIPLAIELAAARVKALTLEQIAERLDDRFRLLTGGSRTAVPRHQTLRALVDWSYELLTEPERQLLRRLTVFTGSWTLEAAEGVCADTEANASILEDVAQLVDKSLVLVDQHDEDGESRYRLLETIRQYAAERLGGDEETAVRQRHREWFLRLAEAAEAQVWGREQVVGLDRLAREHGDLRAALRWSTERHGAEVEPGLLLAGALWRFWQVRGHLREGRGWLAQLLAAASSGDDGPHLPTLGRAKALNAVAFLAFMEGDYTLARERHTQALDIRRALGDRQGIAESLNNLGLVLRCAGEHNAAIVLLDEALAMSRALGNLAREAHILNNLARAAYYRGDLATAQALHEQCLVAGREVGDTWVVAICLGDLGDLCQAQGARDAAAGFYQESLALWHELGDHRGVAQCLEGFAGLDVQTRPARAVRLIAAATGARELIGEPCSLGRRAVLDRTLEHAREALGNDGYATAWAEGCAMPLDRAIEYAASVADGEPPAGHARGTADPGAEDGGPLTRREREVAHLLARGLTNRQIAEVLIVGERTAETHVANILSKLGLTSRAQAAAWSVEHGLT